jgi:hypothetical protein
VFDSIVGSTVEDADGSDEGNSEAKLLGDLLGSVGTFVGPCTGFLFGTTLGTEVGSMLAAGVGVKLEPRLGVALEISDGATEGVGDSEAIVLGTLLGCVDVGCGTDDFLRVSVGDEFGAGLRDANGESLLGISDGFDT